MLSTSWVACDQVQPFGSYANGLAAHSSDIDVVLLGLLQPLAGGTGGAQRFLLDESIFRHSGPSVVLSLQLQLPCIRRGHGSECRGLALGCHRAAVRNAGFRGGSLASPIVRMLQGMHRSRSRR